VSSCSYLRLKIRKRMLEDRKRSVLMFVPSLKIRKRMLEDRKRSVLMFVPTFEDKEMYA